ncbi:MAG: 1-deoxy-D-xylulose-5-phosphate reductoisomerase [Candidatus Portiera sp.]|nr:1-deoxy-D-xylulose-5-phosphate reductoisomerase [Portiera sp.]
MKICLLGSTGSVGSHFLEVIRENNKSGSQHSIKTLAAATNINKLWEQAKEFQPNKLLTADQRGADRLSQLVSSQDSSYSIDERGLLMGEEGMQQAIEDVDVDCVVNALSGTNGLIASILTMKAGKKLLLANKESLVAGGSVLNKLSASSNSEIIPLDSEHNAIIRCLPQTYKLGDSIYKHGVKKLWLTASGGPFLNKTKQEIATASVEDACKHPTWAMGNKISIDSATMMNKGLEIIESCHLFSINQEDVGVIVHPQSLVHCMVEYNDGSIISQLSKPDMRITIHQALNYPEYVSLPFQELNPLEMGQLDFIKPDLDKFPCLNLAREAQDAGGIIPMVMSVADDHAVAAFLDNRISFGDLDKVIAKVMHRYSDKDNQELTADLAQIKQLTQAITLDSQDIISQI